MKPLKKSNIILASILFIVMLPTLARAQTPTETALTIKGQLVNANSGKPGKANIPLMLHTYDGRQMSGMIDGVTGPDGTFRFEDIQVIEGRIFEVMATVGQTTYFSESAAAAPNQATLELPVTFYDTTPSTDAIRIEQMHLLVDFFNPTLLELSEIYVISNDSDRTVEGAVPLDDGQTATLRFTLPDGATDISFEGGELGQRFIKTEDGFADTFGVPPGPETRQILVRYYLPYQDGMSINRSVLYPNNQSSVIMPQVGVSLTGSGLTPAGTRQIQNSQTVDIFVVDDIGAGQSYSFKLKGQPELNMVSTTPEVSAQPAFSLTSSQQRMFMGLGMVVLGVALLGGGVWWWRRQTTRLLLGSSPFSAATSELSRTDLILTIAALDDQYEAGAVSEPDYTQQRNALRAKLKALLTKNQQIDEFTETEQLV